MVDIVEGDIWRRAATRSPGGVGGRGRGVRHDASASPRWHLAFLPRSSDSATPSLLAGWASDRTVDQPLSRRPAIRNARMVDGRAWHQATSAIARRLRRQVPDGALRRDPSPRVAGLLVPFRFLLISSPSLGPSLPVFTRPAGPCSCGMGPARIRPGVVDRSRGSNSPACLTRIERRCRRRVTGKRGHEVLHISDEQPRGRVPQSPAGVVPRELIASCSLRLRSGIRDVARFR